MHDNYDSMEFIPVNLQDMNNFDMQYIMWHVNINKLHVNMTKNVACLHN